MAVTDSCKHTFRNGNEYTRSLLYINVKKYVFYDSYNCLEHVCFVTLSTLRLRTSRKKWKKGVVRRFTTAKGKDKIIWKLNTKCLVRGTTCQNVIMALYSYLQRVEMTRKEKQP